MSSEKVNEFNAYGYTDNFGIIDPIGNCVGCEHNQSEAVALVQWLNSERGGGYSVRKHTPDQVRAAKQFRKDVIRHPSRDEAFADMGVR